MQGSFVSYYRVSTVGQGKSGLGVEAQRQAVHAYLNGGDWRLLAEFTEVESGKTADRPQLAAAMERCRLTGATLIIAKLDRLSRDLHFITGLQKAGVQFRAADNPHANNLTVHILAAVAQQEREMISERTRAALKAYKARCEANPDLPRIGRPAGKPWGPRARKVDSAAGTRANQARALAFAASVHPTVSDLRHQGLSLRAIAAELEAREIRTPRGGKWSAKAVMQILG